MPVLCIGPVCIPLNLLLPFLLGVAHHYGWLKWVKREWVTLQHWRQRFCRPQPAAADGVQATAAASQQPQYVCEGGVCKLVPADSAGGCAAADAATEAAVTAPAGPGSSKTAALQKNGSSAAATGLQQQQAATVRQRQRA